MNSLELDTALPEKKRDFLRSLVDRLQNVSGIQAIALGGSYAEGTAHADSDLDLGLYYSKEDPFATDEVEAVVRGVAAEPEAYTITDFYAWGPWVNGGAWIQTPVGKVDFLYRNLGQIRRTVDEAHQGTIHHDYNQQPAYGFYSVTYLAETQICKPLFDPVGALADLKRQVATYPPKLKARVVQDSLWGAEFSLRFARSFADSGDVYNAVGCLTRIASNLTQALFALNETYYLGDKRAMEKVQQFAIKPPNYVQELTAVFSCPGRSTEELSESVAKLEDVWERVVDLAGEMYQPAFPS